ncbi:Aste57867_19040 [Aphanomyces stellatus]|uniref:Aste57867_19040 protein n=1 Tax=Aphanomyces stellatus TaxID=120398 RepID=A0A485LCF7_9STRA|nr:hypothetical protein As57867_018976 [Aphanomyces stellatus]VFT95765.1 Aste57867_19040 [Aphanomyces stellatus]
MWRIVAGLRPTSAAGKASAHRLFSAKPVKGGSHGKKHGPKPDKKHAKATAESAKTTHAEAKPSTKVAAITAADASSKLDPYVRDIAIYIGTASLFLLGAATYKNYISDDSIEMDVFVQAKYLASRNKTVIDLTGLPTVVEKTVEKVEDDATTVPGKLVLGGVKGKVTIEYVAHRDIKDESGKHVFVSLDLIQHHDDDDGTKAERISLLHDNPRAPKSPEEEAQIKEKRQGELLELGSNLVLPGIGFFAGGCVAAYMMLRILRNRPSYVIQLAVDRLNTAPRVVEIVGSPIKTNKNVYVGSISDHFAAFESKVSGPKGEGTMKVQAMRPKTGDDAPWQFTQLSLDVQGRSKRINLLDKEMK